MYCISYRTSFIAIFWITQSSAIFWITQICVQGACSHVNSKRGVTSSAASLVMASELPLIGISHMFSFVCPNALTRDSRSHKPGHARSVNCLIPIFLIWFLNRWTADSHLRFDIAMSVASGTSRPARSSVSNNAYVSVLRMCFMILIRFFMSLL